MEKKVIDFSRSESNSSFESEGLGAARGNDEDAEDYESDEYGAFKDDFRPASTFPLKRSSYAKDSDTTRWGGGASYGAAIVSMIDQKMKEHANHLLRAAHGISRKITQLENRTSQLEGLIDNLKDTTEFYHRRSERRLGDVEDMMTKVQGGIQDLKDKQKIAEVQLDLAKAQQIRADLQTNLQNRNVQNKLVWQQVSYVYQNPQQLPSPATCQEKLSDLPSYGLPSSLQNSLQVHANPATQMPQQLGQNQSLFIQQNLTCYQPPLPTLDSANQQHHTFPTQSVTQYQPYMNSSLSESSQLPRPQPLHSTHHSFNQMNHQPQERPYMPSEGSCHSTPKLSYATGMVSPPRQFNVVPTQNINNQPFGSSMATQGHLKQPGNYNLSDHDEASPSHYWGSTMKTSQPLATAKVPPRALPMAKDVNEVSSSGGTESSVSIEDIVENAVAMGFRRDTVRATVKKLTENEQPVDLNLVLDKLINSGETHR